ncbi:cell wall-active antibiotics response protein [Massilia forsythiae]|uniref:Cell wall-active antibiotics response protein n=1 Tax=Massilia forsythiae TaxID=2728020 RepID=A0A7Z2W152_9BURK|nr:DUF5668 domain-containing protein [Massilia forsythiae]QJE02868.1 cell wall-active antibiotics response protein [Massilia forsythiae]
METRTNRASSQVILGLLVIGMGVLFLLDNLDILDFHRAIGFWPVVFVAAGAIVLSGDGPRSGNVTGLALIALGVLMMLGRLGLFHISWAMIWPLLLIGLGGLILYRTLGPGRVARPNMVDASGDETVVDVVAILGGVERRVRTQTFLGGEITAIMGGCALDLRESSILKEAVLNVFTIWGGINIKVPPDWTVVLNGTPLMGGFSEKTAAAPDAGKRLVIRGYAIMGGVEVRN